MNLRINYLKLPNLTKKMKKVSMSHVVKPKNLSNIPVVGVPEERRRSEV